MSRDIHYCDCGEEIFGDMVKCRKCDTAPPSAPGGEVWRDLDEDEPHRDGDRRVHNERGEPIWQRRALTVPQESGLLRKWSKKIQDLELALAELEQRYARVLAENITNKEQLRLDCENFRNEAIDWKRKAVSNGDKLRLARETLRGIADADFKTWDEGLNTPAGFVRWAKSRATFTLDKLSALGAKV